MRHSFKVLVASASLAVAGAAQAAPVSLFDISQPTHAIVDDKSPVFSNAVNSWWNEPVGYDKGNTFSSAYIYNMFGAANTGVEGTGNVMFEQNTDKSAPMFVKFHTAAPVDLTSVALTVNGSNGMSDGVRGIYYYNFQQYTDSTYSTPTGALYTLANQISPNGGSYWPGTYANDTPMTLATSITGGQYFQLTMYRSGEPWNINNPWNEGPRVLSFTGAVPEPASLGLLSLAGMAMLRRRR